MFILIIIGILILIWGLVVMYNYSIRKYSFNPIYNGDDDSYIIEIISFFLLWAGLLFQYYTVKRIGWIDINLNTFILWTIGIILLVVKFFIMTSKSNIFISLSFITFRIIIGIILSIIISYFLYKAFNMEDTFFGKLILFQW